MQTDSRPEQWPPTVVQQSRSAGTVGWGAGQRTPPLFVLSAREIRRSLRVRSASRTVGAMRHGFRSLSERKVDRRFLQRFSRPGSRTCTVQGPRCGEFGEPQREVEVPLPARVPSRPATPVPQPVPEPERTPEPERAPEPETVPA